MLLVLARGEGDPMGGLLVLLLEELEGLYLGSSLISWFYFSMNYSQFLKLLSTKQGELGLLSFNEPQSNDVYVSWVNLFVAPKPRTCS